MMNQIRVEQPFTLYAQCTVDYDGRAKSTLELGNYLIIHKSDGTLLIQGGTLCTPRNYQPPKAIMRRIGSKLVSTLKNETITITIDRIHFYKELHNWSAKKIDINKTEAQLRDKILNNIESYLGVKVKETYREFRTPVGNLDILAIDIYDTYHIIEVKRGKANLATCSQLERYCHHFTDLMKNVKDYIASPDISDNALRFSQENYQTYLKVEHSI
jgi:RecB family endonuclease NucS